MTANGKAKLEFAFRSRLVQSIPLLLAQMLLVRIHVILIYHNKSQTVIRVLLVLGAVNVKLGLSCPATVKAVLNQINVAVQKMELFICQAPVCLVTTAVKSVLAWDLNGHAQYMNVRQVMYVK